MIYFRVWKPFSRSSSSLHIGVRWLHQAIRRCLLISMCWSRMENGNHSVVPAQQIRTDWKSVCSSWTESVHSEVLKQHRSFRGSKCGLHQFFSTTSACKFSCTATRSEYPIKSSITQTLCHYHSPGSIIASLTVFSTYSLSTTHICYNFRNFCTISFSEFVNGPFIETVRFNGIINAVVIKAPWMRSILSAEMKLSAGCNSIELV